METISPRKGPSLFASFPVVIGVAGTIDDSNPITLAYIYPMSIDPPMVGVGIGKTRHSHEFFSSSDDFTVNIVSDELLDAARVCGSKSGRSCDKWTEAGITAIESKEIRSPRIKEAKAVLECKKVGSFETGDHTCFLGEIVAVLVEEDYEYLENVVYWRGKYGKVVPF